MWGEMEEVVRVEDEYDTQFEIFNAKFVLNVCERQDDRKLQGIDTIRSNAV
jgi:hypothetical protein